MVSSLNPEEEVVRYIGGSKFDSVTGQVGGSAFERPLKDKDGLSFTRRYVFSTDDEQDKKSIRKVFSSRMKVGSTAQFAQLQVGEALASLREFDELFDFVEDPLTAEGDYLANPAHVLLEGLPFKGEVVGSLKSELAGDLLARCVTQVFSASANAL